MKNLKKNTNIIFLFFLLFSYILIPVFGLTNKIRFYPLSTQTDSNSIQTTIDENDKSINLIDLAVNLPIPEKLESEKVEEVSLSFDKNNNGISDKLELKFGPLKEQNDQIPIIVQFLEDTDPTSALLNFETYGGIVKNTYDAAINGFAGTIDYEGLEKFSSELKSNKVSILIEEDSIVKANLYYMSRNMNLRPYTWNTLDFTGDNESSIAILDTGIDDTHSFFPEGYGAQDFTKKIVGWQDEINPPSPWPSDDNGHGSHVAGIAAGEGSSYLDGLGRTVSTGILNLDFVGFPIAFPDGYYVPFTIASFNVTTPGRIDIECNFTDYTAGADRMEGWAYLFHGGSIVDSLEYSSDNWDDNLTYTVNSNTVGEYSLKFRWFIDDNTGNGEVWDPDSRFRGVIHWPFTPPLHGGGDPWRGVAPDARLVGVKVLDADGYGSSSEIIDGINWVITEKENYNITVMSLSLGGDSGQSAMITAVNNAVEAGIVTVVAAGNDGSGGYEIGSPGDADNVITVAAMNYDDMVTQYSSQGGTAIISNTTKPDILAPGGSVYDFTTFSAESNDVEGEGAYSLEYIANDTMPAQGTSMATPAVAGAANLLIQAMGGRPNWNFTAIEAKRVKALLLMTATETFPLFREIDTAYSPSLNRGGKDVHEGYGRINIDAAIEAWTIEINPSGVNYYQLSPTLNTSSYNPYGKHASAGYVQLIKNQNYTFNLTVPDRADYDLYLYNYTPSNWGEPVLVASGISPAQGGYETFNFTASHTGKYFLVAKAIGKAIPGGDGDDDDDKDSLPTIDLLTILIIVGIIALLAIIFVIILVKRSNRDDTYEFRADY